VSLPRRRVRGLASAAWVGLLAAQSCTPSVLRAPAPSPTNAASAASEARTPDRLVIRNNHTVHYEGPVELTAALPDGAYEGAGAYGEVVSSSVRAVVSLAPGDSVGLHRTGVLRPRFLRSDVVANGVRAGGSLAVGSAESRLTFRWNGIELASSELGLVVVAGTRASVDDVAGAFRPLAIAWHEQPDGSLRGDAAADGYAVTVTAIPYAGGWINARAGVARTAPTAGPAYVALVRRLTMPGFSNVRLRFNGRQFDSASSPEIWDRDFWYTRGVDWISWRANGLSMAVANGFAPVPTIERDSSWREGSHFYVWEKTRRVGDQLYLVSEIAGPNEKQSKAAYMSITPYAPLTVGDTVNLSWRMAITERPREGWEESQLRVFAGYRADSGGPSVKADLGVRGVSFGTSYFPYSTFAENFDWYRSPGMNQETWWPIATGMWAKWREFIPRMHTDLYIIRAMGFEWVRLHHLELLQTIPRDEAFAFLDWYVGQARELGLKILMDSEGPPEWMASVAGRYPDVIQRVEIENEILIGGVKKGFAERWTSEYRAVKAASPNVQAYLTNAGNHGQFERLRQLGVPFDRVGLHAYKHGPEWVEAYSSHALGTAGYAMSIGRAVTLGEFNWKELTRWSPEARQAKVAEIYRAVLEPRAIPELFQFHFQETMSVNPSMSRSGIRHYEPVYLDRRLKPEGAELVRVIREYSRPDATVRDLLFVAPEVKFVNGRATATVRMTNLSSRIIDAQLDAVAFDGTTVTLVSQAQLATVSGANQELKVELSLPKSASSGTYHYFVRARYDGRTAIGWGVAANVGAPVFAKGPVLGRSVRYPQGAGIVDSVDWTKPIAVAFGKRAPVLEMEMAYTLANTLQAATGNPVYLSSAEDMPDSVTRSGGTLLLVGTPPSNRLIGVPIIPTPDASPAVHGKEGIVLLTSIAGGGHRLIFTGADKVAIEAAATDFVLRFWPNAKDAAIRIAGMEPGAALGHRAEVANADPP
jgi:hypothetical protein